MEDTMKPAYRILDIGFNVAVAHLADKTARSFRVADIAPHAALASDRRS